MNCEQFLPPGPRPMDATEMNKEVWSFVDTNKADLPNTNYPLFLELIIGEAQSRLDDIAESQQEVKKPDELITSMEVALVQIFTGIIKRSAW